MNSPARSADWTRLFRIAVGLIQQVNADQPVIDRWTLGGGTAMMLQIDHRESRDVDIFLDDAQFLSFLDPKTHDFRFEIAPSTYDGDGRRFLKIAFEGIGEIDFITASALTASPTNEQIVEGETVLLESIPEIITKKIYYRGAGIKPRDIFDIAAASESHADALVVALKEYQDGVAQALQTIDRLNPDFVRSAIAQLAIRERHVGLIDTALPKAVELLKSVSVSG